MEFSMYYCSQCNKNIEVFGDSNVNLCCNTKLEKIIPNSQDASLQKHIPVISIQGNDILVEVGAIQHPMSDNQHISTIYVVTDDNCVFRKELKTSDIAKFTCNICDANKVDVYAYCNLHGLWTSSYTR
ncbi:MAG: desulfoferrodoxin family protein [Clostridia bacterium]